MRVLVTAASKHGSTEEIARVIGEVLAGEDHEVTVLAPQEVGDVDAYDAVVLGSGVYAAHWLKPALELVERSAEALAARPLWLFSSGPVGDPPKPEEDPVDIEEVLERTQPRDHRVLAGRIDKKRLSFPEKAIVMALKVPEGDFRDWDEIRGWAAKIAGALRAEG
ncbi:MAG TPA: flavodoxin domain-containing protein [Actinomycetota bacterium]|nr:flavodoxin domain-containing protein [Actinomycetota bacterium]